MINLNFNSIDAAIIKVCDESPGYWDNMSGAEKQAVSYLTHRIFQQYVIVEADRAERQLVEFTKDLDLRLSNMTDDELDEYFPAVAYPHPDGPLTPDDLDELRLCGPEAELAQEVAKLVMKKNLKNPVEQTSKDITDTTNVRYVQIRSKLVVSVTNASTE